MRERKAIHARDTSLRGIVARVPVFDGERFMGSAVLKARKHTDAVIVADDVSTDARVKIAEEAGVIIVKQGQDWGKGAAQNTGVPLTYSQSGFRAFLPRAPREITFQSRGFLPSLRCGFEPLSVI